MLAEEVERQAGDSDEILALRGRGETGQAQKVSASETLNSRNARSTLDFFRSNSPIASWPIWMLPGSVPDITDPGGTGRYTLFMRSLIHLARHPLWRYASYAVVALIAIGGFFIPALALAVPVLMIAAIALDFFRRRSFCAGICPNGTFLASTLKPVSRKRPLPRALVSPTVRRALCGFMLVCIFGLLARSPLEASAIGRNFWAIYTIALTAGILFGLLYKPRAWCAICPLGTLQDTIRQGRVAGTVKLDS
jgi:hypothetical protein